MISDQTYLKTAPIGGVGGQTDKRVWASIFAAYVAWEPLSTIVLSRKWLYNELQVRELQPKPATQRPQRPSSRASKVETRTSRGLAGEAEGEEESFALCGRDRRVGSNFEDNDARL